MSPAPELKLHHVPPSHPSRAVEAALVIKGLDFELVDMSDPSAPHTEAMEAIFGEGNGTVPGLTVDGEPVHGSRPIMARIEELAPDPPLFPADRADEVREAERWGDDELQQLGRDLAWGALHFRPEQLGVVAGGEPLDPAGTDFAIRYVRATWRYHGLTAVRIAEDLEGLPEKLDHVDALIADGVIGGETPNAADLQIGSTLRIFDTIGDLAPLLADRPAGDLGERWFPEYMRGAVLPAGAFPAGWVPERS
ncbi:MAG: glutathione S-transferase family protein [Solirubrobacterales bacterium]|nr:glutathione S-transferase family protein [Solirubrobacterales bacterium]MCB8969610.1 glutathione S-transferase family protein [Thermoleophilales bacterium]MCO5327399.1 glutathione S-transferase family protein [Solirubrobacterales bacterium]